MYLCIWYNKINIIHKCYPGKILSGVHSLQDSIHMLGLMGYWSIVRHFLNYVPVITTDLVPSQKQTSLKKEMSYSIYRDQESRLQQEQQ
jgi:hypothetical protein